MAFTTERVSGRVLAPRDARRAGRELALEVVFRPVSSVLVPPLSRLRVPPVAVLLGNAVAGLGAALAIGGADYVLGAILLQAKTLLDNTDGQLARATGRVTLAGRYLDTVADLCVNVAVFIALAHATGRPLLAAAALFALTLVLAVDFNMSQLAREVFGNSAAPARASAGRAERLLGSVYSAVFASQDRLVRNISARRFRTAVGGHLTPDRAEAARRAYFDSLTLTALANLGLTTQLVVLGFCLVVGVPEVYLWLAVASLVALVPLQIRREHRARRAAWG